MACLFPAAGGDIEEDPSGQGGCQKEPEDTPVGCSCHLLPTGLCLRFITIEKGGGGLGKEGDSLFRLLPAALVGSHLQEEGAGGQVLVVVPAGIEDALDQAGIFSSFTLFICSANSLMAA